MNKINMAELLADREKGTEGPWHIRTLENFGFNIVHYVNGDKFDIARVARTGSEQNARRLRRLPDLEAAYIEAVAEIEALKHDLARSMETANAYLNERESLTRHVAELEGALKPFDDANRFIADDHDDDYAPDWSPFLPVKHYRRVRAVLTGEGE